MPARGSGQRLSSFDCYKPRPCIVAVLFLFTYRLVWAVHLDLSGVHPHRFQFRAAYKRPGSRAILRSRMKNAALSPPPQKPPGGSSPTVRVFWYGLASRR